MDTDVPGVTPSSNLYGKTSSTDATMKSLRSAKTRKSQAGKALSQEDTVHEGSSMAQHQVRIWCNWDPTQPALKATASHPADMEFDEASLQSILWPAVRDSLIDTSVAKETGLVAFWTTQNGTLVTKSPPEDLYDLGQLEITTWMRQNTVWLDINQETRRNETDIHFFRTRPGSWLPRGSGALTTWDDQSVEHAAPVQTVYRNRKTESVAGTIGSETRDL